MGDNLLKIEVFFVDVGGVLLDHSHDKIWFHEKVALAAKRPIEVIGSIYQEGVRRYWSSLETGVVSPYQFYRHYAATVQSLLPLKEWTRFAQTFNYAYFRESFGNIFVPKPRVIDFMMGLRSKGMKVILVSNNNPIHYEYCLRTAPQIFRVVDDCILSQEVGCRKPDPQIWDIALKQASYHCGKIIFPEQVFCIDDKPENVDSFRLLGGNGAVFKDIKGLKEDLRLFEFKFEKVKIPA